MSAAPKAPCPLAVMDVPISVGRQEREPTDPKLTFYRTRLNYGTAENAGNTVAFVFGNNGSNAAEQMAFAEALVSAYNNRAKVAELVDAQRRANRNARLMHDDRQQELVCIPPADWAALRAALAAFSEVQP